MNPYSTGSPVPDMSPTILTLGKMAMDRQAQNDDLAMREKTLAETARQHNLTTFGTENPEPGQQTLSKQTLELARQKQAAENPGAQPFDMSNYTRLASKMTLQGIPIDKLSIMNSLRAMAENPSLMRGDVATSLTMKWPELKKQTADDLHNEVMSLSNKLAGMNQDDPKYKEITGQISKLTQVQGMIEKINPDMVTAAFFPDIYQHDLNTKAALLVNKPDNSHQVQEVVSPDGRRAQKLQYNPQTRRYDIPLGQPYLVKSQVPNVNVHVAGNPKGTSDNIETLAQGVLDGSIDPNAISKRGGLQGAVWSRVKKIDPKFNIVQAGATAKWESANTNMNTKALLNTIDPLLTKLEQSGAVLGNSSLPLYNRAVNFLKEQGGSADIVGFNNLRDDVIAEVERGLMGTGVLSDSKYMRALKNINSAQSYPQLKAAVKNIKTVIQARLESLNAGPYQKQGGAQTTQQTNFRSKYNY